MLEVLILFGRDEMKRYMPAMLNKLKTIEIGFETSSKPICALVKHFFVERSAITSTVEID